MVHNNTTIPLKEAFSKEYFKLSMTIIYSIIFTVGIPGNILVILTICRVKKMRSARNLFLGNLAVGDFVNVCWCLPMSVVSLYIPWPYGEVVCKYIFPLTDVIISNTVFTMVAIMLYRYRAIVHPFTRKPTLCFTLCIIVINWMICYLLSGLPLVLVNEISEGYWVKLSCNTRWTNPIYKTLHRVGTCVIVFCLPFIIILFCFLRMKVKLQLNIRFATKSIRGRSKFSRARKHQKLINMLLTIFLSFTICFLPVNILLIIELVDASIIASIPYAGVLFQLSLALLFLNSTMNPIILYILSKDFKLGFLEQLKCFCPNSKFLSKTVQRMRRYSRIQSLKFSREHKDKLRQYNNDIDLCDNKNLSTDLLNTIDPQGSISTTDGQMLQTEYRDKDDIGLCDNNDLNDNLLQMGKPSTTMSTPEDQALPEMRQTEKIEKDSFNACDSNDELYDDLLQKVETPVNASFGDQQVQSDMSNTEQTDTNDSEDTPLRVGFEKVEN